MRRLEAMVLPARRRDVLFIEILTVTENVETRRLGPYLLNNLRGWTIIQSPRNTMPKAVSHVPACRDCRSRNPEEEGPVVRPLLSHMLTYQILVVDNDERLNGRSSDVQLKNPKRFRIAGHGKTQRCRKISKRCTGKEYLCPRH